MKKINKLIFPILLFVFYFVFPPLANAAYFRLEPQSQTIAPDGTFNVDITIDTEGENVTSADVLFTFNPSILQVNAITPGTFFPQNFKTVTASQIYVGGAVQNATENRQGAGILSTITFNAIGSGTSSLAFDCTAGKTADSNITQDDRNATDILDCSKLVDGAYTVSGNITNTQNQPTPTSKQLPASGAIGNTLLISGIGIILTIIGIMVML